MVGLICSSEATLTVTEAFEPVIKEQEKFDDDLVEELIKVVDIKMSDGKKVSCQNKEKSIIRLPLLDLLKGLQVINTEIKMLLH